MSLLKGTPAYWKQFLFDVLAMVKQLAIPTYFLTLPCGDQIENEAAYIEFIDKTINLQLPNHLSDPELFRLVKNYHSRSY